MSALSSRSCNRCAALACVQGTLTLAGIVLSVWPYFQDHGVGRPPECLVGTSLCTAHWGLWMSPPASFWAGVAAACMFQGVSKGDKRALATAFDLQVLVAPCCALLFLLLGWKALSTAAGVPSDGEGVTFKAVGAYAGLSLVMQAQAISCTVGACLVRSLSKEKDERGSSSGGGGSGSGCTRSPDGRRLPRGWRHLSTADGRSFYEHRRTGRVQWDVPGGSAATSSETEEGLSSVPEGTDERTDS